MIFHCQGCQFDLSGLYFHFSPDLELPISVFGFVRFYEISVRFYDILSGFMNFIYTLKIDFTKLYGFMKSPLHDIFKSVVCHAKSKESWHILK